MAKEFKLTRERLKELEAELNYLKTTKEKEVPSATFPKTVNTMKPKTSRPSSMAASRKWKTSSRTPS